MRRWGQVPHPKFCTGGLVLGEAEQLASPFYQGNFMKIKDLIEILSTQDPEQEIAIVDNGSILKSSSVEAMIEYNQDNDTGEYFIPTEEY
jgi:hypothetical protein